MNTIISTLLSYLKSKTVQGILGLLFLGILKTQHIDLLSNDTMASLSVIFLAWLGIGFRNAIKPLNTPTVNPDLPKTPGEPG